MIPIAQPFLGFEEADAARAVVLSGWLSQGSEVASFETEFAADVCARHACAVSNCTTALHLALLAVGVRQGSEVVTVSHSFIAGANSIRHVGAIPVFVDIEEGGFNIDPSRIADAITPRTQAILCVHQMGMPCDLQSVSAIAKQYSLPLIEDAACAIGSQIRIDDTWRKIGKPHGDIVCFSFHPRKVLTTGEGGMLTTDNDDHDRFFRLARQHGMSISDGVRHASPRVIFEEYLTTGYNYRMTDIQAAIGRQQLKRLPEIVARRRSLAMRYRVLLTAVSGVRAPSEPGWTKSNWQSFAISLDIGLDQKRVMQHMLDNGVATRRGIMCAHREAAYTADPRPHALGRSEAAQDRSILLPLFPQMTDEAQQQVVDALRAAIKACSKTPAMRLVKA
ncbi:DegT/DnrJ/EryC1/StrS family aminotransferase (plasmid) [Paracoccus liaowanqingii]|uniref:DegT/DnrJ/EryC1/StrS family aminotransferase n=1 Tax=Paracoccus liaowanqingii TaxID=2560053 RepID=A0A4Y5SSY3_9RHOB|nr:DegT/DnrJ/EryC1/StrS family aminotransferase [Paracoccus liaowanqingii]QDA35824.1 DegT/DnrJ/EryC1/StrS family aminotransferase [Paracoccus liaowanqingii]